MKIAHLTTVDTSLRHLLLAQLDAIREHGDQPIGISAPGSDVPMLEERGIRHLALPTSTRSMNPLADARAAVGLLRLLRSERVDVLHTHNPKPGLYGRVVGRLAGTPVVVNTVHGIYPSPDAPRLKRWLGTALEVLAARFSHAELLQNPEDLARLRRTRGYPRARAHLLGNGVDLRRFRPDRLTEDRRRALRRTIDVADDQLLVGCVARLVREKGLPELFDAAARLGPRYVVAVIGPDDPDKADAITLEEQARAHDAGVRFLGMRDDVDDLYAAMDLFVLPSHREGFPRSAMEAAATGVPVIATDVRGCRQVVDHGVTGLLVPVRDPASLADAILELGEDEPRRQRMATAARERALEAFDERQVVDTVLAVYDRQLASLPAHRPDVRRRLGLALKRASDLLGGAVLLIVTAPLLALVGVAVRVKLGRPVLFRQPRPGQRGHVFTIYKLRTMSEPREGEHPAASDAERLTPLGRFLRSTSLDELPELVNVIRGDMSLVGPRPLLVEYLDRYTPEQHRRHGLRPGLTGWAQVNGRNAVTWEDRLALDAWYVDHWSLWLDLRILARTVGTVVRRRGVSADDHATMPVFEGSPE
jgi:lipopolysaccharide/colanic/teichoic acid biosynthesis glycosyltransferase/glycosyltransferase involved in cell wall biosynthesis